MRLRFKMENSDVVIPYPMVRYDIDLTNVITTNDFWKLINIDDKMTLLGNIERLVSDAVKKEILDSGVYERSMLNDWNLRMAEPDNFFIITNEIGHDLEVYELNRSEFPF
jgi:hypothetical protein